MKSAKSVRRRLWAVGLIVAAFGGFAVTGWTDIRTLEDAEWKAPARAARKKNPLTLDDKSIAAGQAVYAKECLSCHGKGGKGDGEAAKDLNPKPNDLTVAKVWEQSDGALFWKLTEGRKPMPAYDKLLSDDDRWNVINYMRKSWGPKEDQK